jgi:uncharacterized membrane protein YphA (DoxX/SURF4 family)
MKLIAAATGATMVAGGIAKLAKPPAYETLVKDLGWSDQERQAIGVAELVGGALMLLGPTRRIGAGIVLAASGAALAVELKSGASELAAPRAGVVLAALLVAAAGT